MSNKLPIIRLTFDEINYFVIVIYTSIGLVATIIIIITIWRIFHIHIHISSQTNTGEVKGIYLFFILYCSTLMIFIFFSFVLYLIYINFCFFLTNTYVYVWMYVNRGYQTSPNIVFNLGNLNYYILFQNNFTQYFNSCQKYGLCKVNKIKFR